PENCEARPGNSVPNKGISEVELGDSLLQHLQPELLHLCCLGSREQHEGSDRDNIVDSSGTRHVHENVERVSREGERASQQDVRDCIDGGGLGRGRAQEGLVETKGYSSLSKSHGLCSVDNSHVDELRI